MLDLQPHRPCSRPLAENHVEGEILHGRVQDLLDHVAQPMDLVDEQDVALAQAGQHRGEVPGALDRGARGGPDLGTHLRCHDVGQRRLAQPWRAVQQDVVDRLGPMTRRVEEDGEVLLDAPLAREFVETPRSDGRLERQLLGLDLCGGDALDRHEVAAGTPGESNM